MAEYAGTWNYVSPTVGYAGINTPGAHIMGTPGFGQGPVYGFDAGPHIGYIYYSFGAVSASGDVSKATGVNPTETSYSLYGHNIPLSVFGVGRIGGDIIAGPWVDNGKASFIISFGVPADPYGSRDLREIAFDSEVVWEGGSFNTEPFVFRFYPGRLDQAADPLETSHFGADAVAYRPQILLAFENLPLAGTKFGKIPYVAALFGDSTGDDVNLGEAFTRLSRSPWVGWTSSQFEAVGITDGLVNGGLIITEQAEFLATIQQFGRFYPNWNILQTDKLRLVDRGSNVTADITLDRTRLMGNVAFTRAEPNAAARELELTTIDPGADYTLVPSTASRRPHDPVEVTSSVKVDTAYLPAIMDASFRQAIVTYALYHEEQSRKKISLTAMLYGLEIEPGDLIAVTGLGDDFHDEVFKVAATTHGVNYAVEIQAEAILKCTVSGSYSPTTPGALAQWAVSRSRILVPGYAGQLDHIDVPTGKMTIWYDQSGSQRDLVITSTSNAPAAITSGPNSRACADFVGSNPDEMHTSTSSIPPDLITDVMSESAGYIVISIRPDVVTQNPVDGGGPTAAHLCAGIIGAGPFWFDLGLSVRADATLHAFNNDGSGSVDQFGGDPDTASSAAGAVPVGGNPCVVEWWHQDGFLNQRVNGAGQTSVASGDTSDLTGLSIRMGHGGVTGTQFDGKIFEAMIFSTVPTLAERDAIVADMMDWVGA